MKTLNLFFTVIFTALFTAYISAQENDAEEPVFFIVEEMPEYPGGEEDLKKYIAENVTYPEEAQKNGIEGKVFVTFIVSKNGSVKDARIARGVSPSLDKEAIRVVNSLPKWKPGKQRGKTVNVKYTIPIQFKLNGENGVDETAETEEVIFHEVEQMPEFPGGEKALREFIANNVQYPKTAKEQDIQGKVFVTFIVSKDGSIKNAKVVRSVNSAIDKEALRVINSMPSWTPGKQRGKKVDVQFTLPINFSLGEEK